MQNIIQFLDGFYCGFFYTWVGGSKAFERGYDLSYRISGWYAYHFK